MGSGSWYRRISQDSDRETERELVNEVMVTDFD